MKLADLPIRKVLLLTSTPEVPIRKRKTPMEYRATFIKRNPGRWEAIYQKARLTRNIKRNEEKLLAKPHKAAKIRALMAGWHEELGRLS